MSVVINGDTGISGVNGHAGAPALKGSDADSGIHFGTNTASISVGGVSKLNVNPAGHLEVLGGNLDVTGNGNFYGTSSYVQFFNESNTSTGYIQGLSGGLAVAAGSGSGNNILFYPGSTPSVSLDSSKRMLIGGHTTARSDVLHFNNSDGHTPQVQIESVQTSYNNGLSVVNNGSQGHGSIVTIGTTSSTTPGGSALGNRAAGWQMGHLQFAAGEGNNLKAGARLSAYTATNNVTDNRVPTYLTLSNSRDSEDAPVERLRLDEQGTFIYKYPSHLSDGVNLNANHGRQSYAYLSERAPGSDGDTRFYRIEIGNTYSGGGHPQILRLNVAFATYHASGMGNCEALIHMRHGSDRLLITKFRKISEVSIGGWFYGMGTSFQLRVFGSTLGTDDAGLILRVQGRTGNGSTYDGNAHIHIACEALGGHSSYCFAPKLIPLGTSAPSDVDSEVTAQNLTWS